MTIGYTEIPTVSMETPNGNKIEKEPNNDGVVNPGRRRFLRLGVRAFIGLVTAGCSVKGGDKLTTEESTRFEPIEDSGNAEKERENLTHIGYADYIELYELHRDYRLFLPPNYPYIEIFRTIEYTATMGEKPSWLLEHLGYVGENFLEQKPTDEELRSLAKVKIGRIKYLIGEITKETNNELIKTSMENCRRLIEFIGEHFPQLIVTMPEIVEFSDVYDVAHIYQKPKEGDPKIVLPINFGLPENKESGLRTMLHELSHMYDKYQYLKDKPVNTKIFAEMITDKFRSFLTLINDLKGYDMNIIKLIDGGVGYSIDGNGFDNSNKIAYIKDHDHAEINPEELEKYLLDRRIELNNGFFTFLGIERSDVVSDLKTNSNSYNHSTSPLEKERIVTQYLFLFLIKYINVSLQNKNYETLQLITSSDMYLKLFLNVYHKLVGPRINGLDGPSEDNTNIARRIFDDHNLMVLNLLSRSPITRIKEEFENLEFVDTIQN